MIKQILGSSPQTTIIGFLKALLVALLPVIQKDDFSIQKDWPYLVGAVLLFMGGRLQKDSNGITKTEDKAIASKAFSNTKTIKQ